MRNLYVTYQDENGGLQSAEVEIEGKVNELTVKKAVQNRLDYYKRDSVRKIIAWSDNERFTWDEESEFYNQK